MRINILNITKEAGLADFQTKLTELLNLITGAVIGIMSLLVVVWGVYIGIKWASARKAEQFVEAKEYLKRFLTGLILMFVIGAIATTIIQVMKTTGFGIA